MRTWAELRDAWLGETVGAVCVVFPIRIKTFAVRSRNILAALGEEKWGERDEE